MGKRLSPSKKSIVAAAASLPATTIKEASASPKTLEVAPCIEYEITHAKETAKALIDSGSEVNLISRAYANICALTVLHSSVSLEAINHQQVMTHGMGLLVFGVTDQLGQQRFFEETFLIADIPHNIVLGMPFLQLANPDIDWSARTLNWRELSVQSALMTTHRIEIIEPEVFIEEALSEDTPTYVRTRVWER